MFRNSLLAASLLTPLGMGLGCQDSFKDCENTRSCPVEGDETGGTSGDGDGDGTGGVSGDGDGDVGGEGGAPVTTNCDPACESPEMCDEDAAVPRCVECLDSEADCEGATPVCDPVGGTCVECLTADDCEDPALSMCESNSCVSGCTDNDDCMRFEDVAGVCDVDSGECVQCTPSFDDRTADDDACGTSVCDPETYSCNESLTQRDKDTCEPCIADSECVADHNCVPMEFKGEAREGGWCLKDSGVDGCNDNPYRSPTPMRASLSDAAPTIYCGINESFATCEAVLDLEGDTPCGDASECGATGLDDGLCEVVSLAAGRCTYECSNPAQCPSDDPGSGCAGDGGESDDEIGSYCGGI